MKLIACPDIPPEDRGKIICLAGATVCPFCEKPLSKHKATEILKEEAA